MGLVMKVEQVPMADVVLGNQRSRRHIQEQGLEELAQSFEQIGVLQPVIVQRQSDGCYLLVAGERRYLAAQTLDLTTIPAVIQSSDRSIRHVQLVENLQREDLNPIDRAEAVHHFMEEEKLNKSQTAKKLGVPRTTLTDWLSILDLPEKYQQAVLNNHYGGSSPLTGSHISLARRLADKLGSEGMFEVALDAVLYYSLTRAETKKVFHMVANRTDFSIEKAVRAVRLFPMGDRVAEDWEWDVDTLVSFLSRSGDYLVKTKDDYIADLDEEQAQELQRQSLALRKLLDEVLEKVSGKKQVS